MHKELISSGLKIRPATLRKRLKSLQDAGLVTQVEERHGDRKSIAHKQRLTLEGRKVAEHLAEIDKIMSKKHGVTVPKTS